MNIFRINMLFKYKYIFIYIFVYILIYILFQLLTQFYSIVNRKEKKGKKSSLMK